MMLSILSCSSNSATLDAHGFSNLVLDKDTLWFGAGYKLYSVDLNQHTATLAYDTKDVVISFVQLDGKNLYFGGYQSLGRDGAVWSLDVDSKDIFWKQEFRGNWFEWGGIVMPPLIDKEVIIVGTTTVMYGLDKAHGDIKWKIKNYWFGEGEELTPILVNGQLFYGADDINENNSGPKQAVVIANPSTGKTLRTISMPGRLGAIPAVHGDCFFVKDYQSYRRDDSGKLTWIGDLRLNCIDLNSGKIIWSFQRNGVSDSSRMSFYNDLVLDVFANELFAIDRQSGALRWESPSLEAAARNPWVIEELNMIALEIPSSDKVIFLDLATGELRDEALLNILSSPMFIGRQAIYGTANAVICIDISLGNVIRSIPVDSQYQIPSED
jgi:outer membrane protein assembly factor BamB